MSKYNTKLQSRQGNGEFSTTKRVATAAQRQQADLDRVAVSVSISHNVWLIDNGMADVAPDELFASVRQ